MNHFESNAHRLARASHLINALLLAAYLYTSFGDAPGFRLVVQVAVFPSLLFTGLVIYLLPRLHARLGPASVTLAVE